MKRVILYAVMLAGLAGCDWVNFGDAPEPMPLGSCLENRLACNVTPRKPPAPKPPAPPAVDPNEPQYNP